MKARAVLITIAVVLLSACSSKREEGPRSPAVATVNGAPITVSQFQKRLRVLKPGFMNISGRRPGGDAKMDLLSQLIEEEMYLQEAARLGIAASDQEVGERLGRMSADYPETFGKELAREGLDAASYRELVARKLTVEKLIDAQVYSKVKVSRGQAGKYFREHKDEFRRPARARARQIVVQTRAEADKITAELRRGADFAALARARSLSPDSKSGGDLGYFSKGEMPPQFAVVFRMRPGGISRVVKSPYGYHIFKLEELRKAAEPDFAEAYPEAVKRLAQEAGEDEFARWHAALKARTRLEVNFDMLRKL